MGAAVQGDAGFRETCALQLLQCFFPVPIIVRSEPSPLRNAAWWQNSRSHPQDFRGSQVIRDFHRHQQFSHTPARLSSVTFLSARTAPSGTMQLSPVSPLVPFSNALRLSYFYYLIRQSQRWIKLEHFGEQCGHCF
jgi:hypothetical protein